MHRTHCKPVVASMVAILLFAVGMECPDNVPMGNDNGNGNGNLNENDNGNGNDNMNDDSSSRLFVVNNLMGITSHANPATQTGNAPAATELPAGAATGIFQPRSVVVTSNQVLIVARQNGGLSVHDDALTATGEMLADRIVDGAATLLDAPIALAYDAANDRLYVGNFNSENGVLVFDDVSDNSFDGDMAPSNMFNPPDRTPSNTTDMTIDALCLDSQGRLYVVDSSGLNVNSSRILRFDDPGTASGETTPDATIESNAWSGIQDICTDSNDRLYIVADTASIFAIDNASMADGTITPDRTIMISGASVTLRGILVNSVGVGFAADTGNDAIVVLSGIASLNGTVNGDAAISGNDTELFTPRHMAIFED